MESREDCNVIKWNEIKLLLHCLRILTREKTFQPIPLKVIKQIFSMIKTLKGLTHRIQLQNFPYKNSCKVNIAICNPKAETTSATNSIVSQPIKINSYKESG